MSGTLPTLTPLHGMQRENLYSALVVITGEKNDWKTNDEMGGW
jgi:hypothetical protein